MESIKTFNIGTDYKDRKTPLSWESHLYAEVVFMDKTQESSAPLLFQLKDHIVCLDELTNWKSGAAFFPKESFILIGEVASLDKKKKQILLANQNVISYRYLVIARGSSPVVTVYGDEFTAGINALVDALRMKAKIPSSFAQTLGNPGEKIREKATPLTSTQEVTIESHDAQIGKIVQPSIHSATSPGPGVELNAINKRLYEVQL